MPAVRPAGLRHERFPVPDAADAGTRHRGGGAGAGPREDDVRIGLERAACGTLLAFAAALQISIAAADILLTITTLLWLTLVIRNRERVEFPPMFWPLAAYAVAPLIASV